MLSPEVQERASRHIDRLARAHRITVHRTKTWESSEADLLTRQVFIPKRIRTGLDYLISLHEIGHIVDPVACRVSPGITYARSREYEYDSLIIEAAAWAWACKTAMPSVLKEMTRNDWVRAGTSWVSYAGPVW